MFRPADNTRFSGFMVSWHQMISFLVAEEVRLHGHLFAFKSLINVVVFSVISMKTFL